MTIKAEEITIPVTTNAAKAAGDLGKLDKSMQGTEKSTKGLATSAGSLTKILGAAGLTMAFRGLASFVSQNNKLFAIQEKAERKLEAITKATGNAAGFTAAQMKKQAAALQEVTTFGDELIMEGQAIIATFKGIQGEAFEKTTEMALNLSAAFGQDLKSSAIQLGKALEDPATGMTALKRIGVSFTEQQKATIKSFQDAGEVAKAQGVILDVLEGQVGGVARAFAQTASGAIKQFDNELGDTREKLGAITTNIQASFIPGMRQVNKTVNTDLIPALKRLSEAFLASSEDSSVVAESMSGIVKTFAGVLNGISLLVNGFKYLSASIRKSINENIESGAAASAKRAENSMVKSFGSVQKAMVASLKGNKLAKKQVDEYRRSLEKQDLAWKDHRKALQDGLKALNGIADATGAESEKIKENVENQRKAKEAREKAAATAKQQAEALKKLKAAYDVLAGTGNVAAAIKAQNLAFKEQIKVASAAKMSLEGLRKFQGAQQVELLRNTLKESINVENAGFEQRKALLTAKLAEIKSIQDLSDEQRLAAQQIFNEQSAELDRQRMAGIAQTTQQVAGVLQTAVGIGQAVSNLRQAQMQKEIEAMRAKGATEEEIAAKEKELARKAAKDQKTLGIFSTLIDTSVAVTKTLASLPFPANIAAAALVAVKGAIQTAAIAATPLPAAQFGGSFVVPPGNAADSGLLRVNQGEEATVKPVRDTGSQGSMVVSIDGNDFRGFITDEINRAFNAGDVQVYRKGAIKTA